MEISARTAFYYLTGLSLWSFSLNSFAMQFESDDGWQVKLEQKVTIGTGWRVEDRDPKLYTKFGGQSIGLSDGWGAANVDSANLNYAKGDRFSTQYKLLSDLHITNPDQSLSGFIRIKSWYDDVLENSNVYVGNQANDYQKNQPLEDAGINRLARYKGIAVLDSYIWQKFQLNEHNAEMSLGRQSIPWGNSIFFQGINQVNPIQYSALRRPGVDIQKEMFVPIWSAYGKFSNIFGGSLEAFYQFKWEASVLDSCGPYWSGLEMGLTTQNQSACNGSAMLSGASTAEQYKKGNYLPLTQGEDGRDQGQFGLAYHYPLQFFKTDFGIYAMQINARMPMINARMGDLLSEGSLLNGPASVEALGFVPAKSFWSYPDHIRIFGFTTKTKINDWVIGSEFSYTPNQPVQRSPNDALLAILLGVGPLEEKIASARNQGAGTNFYNFDRLKKTQFLLNSIKPLPAMLGANKGLLLSEIGLQYTDVGDAKRDIRYGRGFIFGVGAHPTLGGGECYVKNIHPDGCKNDGYVTNFSWGYRLKIQLDYSISALDGLELSPNIFWAHDVNGYASDGQFIQDRKQLGLGLKAKYHLASLDLNYIRFANNAKYDSFRDHDYINVALSYNF
ncbi:DUF1302 family protein [Acinetobacter baumannii]|uniref:DUF1302 domain-containing protein n=1 Tax=Acinetobacter baumannii TaxID=470 RepID=UPI00295800EA|nr:DUF1302 family protein [Acinetobacter baumannii]MDV7609581.1 DUF1302 family protein [Acinetobacter baumannii]MDV7611372.1 DUF1302 family protein [Acinetobacter baumannii]MDV7615563.1 DUF1302 family protein [Acinetobacter baumannii]